MLYYDGMHEHFCVHGWRIKYNTCEYWEFIAQHIQIAINQVLFLLCTKSYYRCTTISFARHLQFTLLQNLVIVCIILYFQCRFRTPTVTDLQAIHKNFVLLHQSIKYLILLYQWWCNSNINCLTPLIVPTTPFTTNHIHVEIISNYLYKGTDHKVCQNILICANLLWDFYIKGL